MTEPTLFDPSPYFVPLVDEQPGEKVSADRRRTQRQAAQLARGHHPISGLRLHADAAQHDDRNADGLRCRDCRFRVVMGGHSRGYPKCYWPDPELYRLADLPRVSLGPATDCRAWFPACTDFAPRPP